MSDSKQVRTASLSRRSALQLGLGAMAMAAMPSAAGGSSPAADPANKLGPDLGLKPLAPLAARKSVDIAASSLGVGMETLDRKMFEPERTYAHLAHLGAKWARLQTGWARTEREKGKYDFAWLDAVVDGVRKAGVQPWFNLGYGNPLYTPGAPHESSVGYIPLFTREAREGWQRYVAALALHFRDRVTHWEIWNEPNITGFWRPRDPDPAGYAEFTKMTVPAIRKAIPNVTIVGGALAGLGSTFAYLDRALDAGLAGWIDKLSYHAYRAIPEANYEQELSVVRAMLTRRKPGIGLWHGECGASSQIGGTGHPFELDGTELQQAKWALRRALVDLKFGIELSSYFHLCDLANYIWAAGPSGKTQRMGLLRDDYTPKLSYRAYQSACALFDSESTRADWLVEVYPVPPAGSKLKGRVGAADTCVATFARRGHPLCAYWKVSDLRAAMPAQEARLVMWTNHAGELSEPVLVDPLHAQVYRLPLNRSAGGYLEAKVPLLDYPLIVTDLAAIAPAPTTR